MDSEEKLREIFNSSFHGGHEESSECMVILKDIKSSLNIFVKHATIEEVKRMIIELETYCNKLRNIVDT